MTQYDKLYELPLIILPESMDNILANILASHNLCATCAWPKQKSLRTSRTSSTAASKFPSPAKTAMLVPSLKVATYDLAPEMRAEGHRRRHRQSSQRHRIRPRRRQLRQRRYGGPLRQTRAHHSRRRGRRRATGPHLQGHQGEERKLAHHRGSRQRRTDGRPRHRRTAHGAHHQPGANDLHRRRRTETTVSAPTARSATSRRPC